MKKKILIGSLVAVAILVLVSFTGVVGYQTTKLSTIAKTSPLFTVRSSRAIDEESNDLTCDYVGKRTLTKFFFPDRNNEIGLVDDVLNLIKRMDDKSLKRFAYLIKYNPQQISKVKEFTYEEIFQSLKQLRDSPDSVIQQIQKRKGSIMMSNVCTIYCTLHNSLECLPILIIFIIALIAIYFVWTPITYVLGFLTLGFTYC